MEEIGKILPGVFKRHVQRRDARVVEILVPLWPRVAGKAMARQCQPVAFCDGTLTLATDCPSWNAQLRQMAEEIRAEINSFLGGPVVKRLLVRMVAECAGGEAVAPQPGIPSGSGRDRTWPDFPSRAGEGTDRVIRLPYAKHFARNTRRVH